MPDYADLLAGYICENWPSDLAFCEITRNEDLGRLFERIPDGEAAVWLAKLIRLFHRYPKVDGDSPPSHDATLFTVDEIVNPPEYTLHIQITSLDPLEAVVITTSDKSYGKSVFPLGKSLRFTPGAQSNHWLIANPELSSDWYILYINGVGEKRFEHYR